MIIGDHPLFRSGLAGLLNQQPDLEVCGQADSAPFALDQMRKHRPDLAIIDVSLKATNGIELVKLMKAEAVEHVLRAVRQVQEGSL